MRSIAFTTGLAVGSAATPDDDTTTKSSAHDPANLGAIIFLDLSSAKDGGDRRNNDARRPKVQSSYPPGRFVSWPKIKRALRS